MFKPMFLLGCFLFPCSHCVAGDPEPSRSFEFNYGATVIEVPNGSQVRVWFPIAQSNEQQQVQVMSLTTPGPLQVEKDSTYGNKIGYFETTGKNAGQFAFEAEYHIVRKESKVYGVDNGPDEKQKKLFLTANRLVPIDGRPVELLQETNLPTEPLAAGEILYNIVDRHLKYDKSKRGYGNGDSVWACNSKTGNCTDFHSLFISLARSNSIPAKFEIGFPLPSDKHAGTIGGYHCWAWFYASGKGWCPVDISEADKHPELKKYYFGRLTEDRVSFSTGRDIVLVPQSAADPLNYFIYPHVEVDGKIWPKDKIKLDFFFKDQNATQ